VVTVRFAPSPTGFLHVGGARTALFNFLYARNQSGKFLLRIEDTDRERSTPEFEKEILDSLKWLGLGWEGKPVRQSERVSVYRKEAEILISKGLAYKAIQKESPLTPTLSPQGRGKGEGECQAILFRMPKCEVKFTDGLRGEVAFNTELFEDTVLIKSDGFPTYHWACIVDDHEVGITDVIRGEDHLTNTAKQILLIEAMGWTRPAYVHLPLILGVDGTPLSKRHGAVAVTQYQRDGFLPEGLVNYLALLGWGPEGNQEFFNLPELIKKFSLKRLIRSAARFDTDKLRWVNAQHLRTMSEEEYLQRIREYFKETPSPRPSPPKGGEGRVRGLEFNQIALLFRSRIQTLKDLTEEASYCFNDVQSYDLEAMNKALATPGLKEKLENFKKALGALPDFRDTALLEKVLRETAAGEGVEAKALIHPLRLALTGKSVSPGIFDLMKVLGKEICLKRLGELIEKL